MTTDGSAGGGSASGVTRVLLARQVLLGRGTAGDPWRCVPAQLDIAGDRLRTITPLTDADYAARAGDARRAGRFDQGSAVGPADVRTSGSAAPADGDGLADANAHPKTILRQDPGREQAQGSPVTVEILEGLLTPALVNYHVHLPLIGLRGVSHAWAGSGAAGMVEQAFFTFEHRLDGPAVRALAQLGAYDALLNGTGCVWEHYYFAESIAEALAEVGLAGVIAPTLQDLVGPGAQRTAENLAATAHIGTSSAWAASGITTAVGPHATDTCSASLLRQALELAASLGLPVHMHLAQSAAEVSAVHAREGLSPARLLTSLLHEVCAGSQRGYPLQVLAAHALYAPVAELQRLAEVGQLTLGACPSSQSIFAFPAPVEAWSAAGLAWRIGTDCAASNDGHNLLAEARLLPALARARRMTQVLASTARHQREEAVGTSAKVDGVARESQGSRGDAPCADDDLIFRRAVAEDAVALSPDRLLSAVMGGNGNLHPLLPCGAIEPGALASLALWSWDHPSLFPEQPHAAAALVFSQPLLALRRLVVRGRDIGDSSPQWREALLDSAAYQRALAAARHVLSRL